MQNHRHTVRNIDPDLILEARMLALQTGQRLGDVINEALESFLEDTDLTDEDADHDIAA
jgi:hypothetical protein